MTLTFMSDLNLSAISNETLMDKVFRFRIIKNVKFQDYLIEQKKEPVELNVQILSYFIQEIEKRFMKVQLNFMQPSNISVGGIQFKDTLSVKILRPEAFVFDNLEMQNKHVIWKLEENKVI